MSDAVRALQAYGLGHGVRLAAAGYAVRWVPAAVRRTKARAAHRSPGVVLAEHVTVSALGPPAWRGTVWSLSGHQARPPGYADDAGHAVDRIEPRAGCHGQRGAAGRRSCGRMVGVHPTRADVMRDPEGIAPAVLARLTHPDEFLRNQVWLTSSKLP